MSRITLNPDELHNSTQYMYSQAIIEDGTLYLSGQIGTNAQNEVAGADFESQAHRAFENIGIILEKVGKDYSDVTKISSYMTDLHNDLPKFRGVWEKHISEPYPCHTTIGVDKLSHIANDKLLIELEAEIPISEEEVPEKLREESTQ